MYGYDFYWILLLAQWASIRPAESSVSKSCDDFASKMCEGAGAIFMKVGTAVPIPLHPNTENKQEGEGDVGSIEERNERDSSIPHRIYAVWEQCFEAGNTFIWSLVLRNDMVEHFWYNRTRWYEVIGLLNLVKKAICSVNYICFSGEI